MFQDHVCLHLSKCAKVKITKNMIFLPHEILPQPPSSSYITLCWAQHIENKKKLRTDNIFPYILQMFISIGRGNAQSMLCLYSLYVLAAALSMIYGAT